jgi:cysteine synthase B
VTLSAAARPGLPSILEAIGRTPLARLRIAGVPAGVEVWGKCEWFNPGGSVKDRTALSLVEEGERSGALSPGKTILDSSSGNTAVGLALVGRAKGYDVELVMPESANQDRVRRCREYGARLVFTGSFSGSDGALLRVREIAAADPERYFYADQYRNPANPLAHYRGTGPEIWEQSGGRITHFVAGLGTAGTVVGAGRFLREGNPRVRIVAVQPDSPLHGLEGLKHMPTSVVPEIYDPRAHDETVAVSTEDALAMAAELSRSVGTRVGHSAAAALVAARDLARRLGPLGVACIVALLPDDGGPSSATVAGAP